MAHQWTSPAIVGALLLSSSVHAVPVVRAIRDLFELRGFVEEARTEIHEYLWTSYEVELERAKPKEEEAKKEEAEPAPIVAPKIVAKAPPDKPAEARPSTAAAGQTLTAKDDPNAPVDFTDFTMAQGTSDKYFGGVTSADGKTRGEVTDPNARGKGTPGGKGTADPTPQAPKQEGPDLSRPAGLASKGDWKCPFPPEADADDINLARVTIAVSVRADGTPSSVKVLSDPGHGFGRAARSCALSQRYAPSLDHDGKAIDATMPPVVVKFERLAAAHSGGASAPASGDGGGRLTGSPYSSRSFFASASASTCSW